MSIKMVVDPVGKQKDFVDFCRLPNLLLSSIGFGCVEKSRPKWMKVLNNCYTLTAFISNIYCFTFIAKAIISMAMSDSCELEIFFRLISGFIYALFAMIKLVLFLWRLKQFKEIYYTHDEIFPKTIKEKIAYEVQRYFWPKWILFILYFYLGATAFISASPIMESAMIYLMAAAEVGFTEAKFGYLKLYEVDYSFDHHSPLAYFVTLAIELMHAHIVIICNLCAEIWLLCFLLQLCMHFDYLIRTLDQYEPAEVKFKKDQQFIANLVKKHQILLNLSDDLNSFFGNLLLLLLMSNAATLCGAGAHTISSGLGSVFLKYSAFIFTAIGQYYLICYYGQQLMDTSRNLADAAYNHAWYNGSSSYKKSILIIIMRSQKGVEINANGYQTICLEAFQMVMGATYRVLALLRETMF